MTALRIAILGTGFMARTHANHLHSHPDATVSAVCSRSLDRARAFADEVSAGQASAWDDFDAMLEQVELDALYVCLPPMAHDGQVESAARRGLHLFLEKPIALDRRRAGSMVRAATEAGVITQVGYHMRFAPAIRRLREMLADGTAGRPLLLQGRFFCHALHGDWWRDVNASGGQIFEQAIHVYDMAIHLLGRPTSVCCFADNLAHRHVEGYSIEDNSVSIIRFASAAMATIAASNCAVPTEWTPEFRVVCEKACLEMTGLDAGRIVLTEGEPAETFFASGRSPQVEPVSADVDPYAEETRDFLAAIRAGRPALAPIEDGYGGVSLVSAALESARNAGEPMVVTPGP